ncbi:hypothetical protein [Stutzerimonas kirkiae]|uniref:Uncharacterized protein n=1 Tax=Stutzerimonas kirkiae TaxID=2211392 RepID=A0A4Q9RDX7_9GAMM|nr:hypothetical protein [Stutzerimonas kirkiae]TBU99888.1 hypothetical protein DNJ96_00910 [Stutzerimonas kirkiae]TBV05181.1 hypothetical protein DNJ95_02885 [Stutzerimonas kirkiae]TBV08084.1 hypothetical protein DNK08_11100 [Stutzerimonas kirkiae]TBV17540.1 hypothetical protein DNK01_01425 [Stutzerimonas kirkiae]
MMYAELIDQEDFRHRLQALGIRVPADADPYQACEYALQGLDPVQAQALRQMVTEVLGSGASVLPSVREAICRLLLPALAP